MRERRPRVQTTTRVQTQNKVELVAPINEYFTVEDIIEIADELVQTKAPRDAALRIVTKDQFPGQTRIKQLTVIWESDTINGEPAPQAVEESP